MASPLLLCSCPLWTAVSSQLSLMLRPTVSLPICLGIKHPIWGLRPDFYYCQTIAGLLMWGALSDGRTGLSFTISDGARQRSHSRVRVPWHSWCHELVESTVELIVRQSPAGKDVCKGHYWIRHQATANKDIEDLPCTVVRSTVHELVTAL
jgi:hypothetical protein